MARYQTARELQQLFVNGCAMPYDKFRGIIADALDNGSTEFRHANTLYLLRVKPDRSSWNLTVPR